MVIHQCDRCGANIKGEPNTVTLNVFHMFDDSQKYRQFELCQDCYQKVKDLLWIS